VLWQRSNGSALGAHDPQQPPPLVVARHDAHSHTAATLSAASARAVLVAGVVVRNAKQNDGAHMPHVKPSD